MGPTATWMAARAVLRRTWLSVVVLGLLVGVVAGVIVAALSGAGRISSSYQRLLDDVDAPDAVLGIQCTGEDGAPDCPTQIAEAVETLTADPAVATVGSIAEQFPSLRTPDDAVVGPFPEACSTGAGELGLHSSTWPRTGQPFARLVEGRFPDPAAVDEIALPAVTAERAGIRVGDSVFIDGWCHGDLPPPKDPVLQVVGVFVGIMDVRPAGSEVYFEEAIGSPALTERLGGSEQSLLAVWLEPGRSFSDVDAALTDGGFRIELAEQTAGVEESLQPDVTGLRLFALASLLAGLAVLGQLLANSVRGAVAETQALHALGARPVDRWAVGMTYGAVLGAAAALVAAVVAAAATPFVPMGAADVIERHGGHSLPAGTIGLTIAAVLVVVIAVVSVPAYRAARAVTPPVRPSAARWPTRFAQALKLGPTPTLGVGFALEPARATQPVPLRTGLGAMVVATAAVAGVITFGASLEHLRTTPRLLGWNWDLFVFLDDTTDPEGFAGAMAASDGVDRSSSGMLFIPGLSFSPETPEAAQAYGFEAAPGAVQPNVLRGRAPEGPSEILLAPGLADRLDLDLGSVVPMYAVDPLFDLVGNEELGIDPEGLDIERFREVPFEVVGIGVVPVVDGRLSTGMALTLDGIARAFPPPSRDSIMQVAARADPNALWAAVLDSVPEELANPVAAAGPEGLLALLAQWTDDQFAQFIHSGAEPQLVFVDLARGADPGAFIADLARRDLIGADTAADYQEEFATEVRPEDIQLNFDDVGWIPSVFGIFMAFTTLAVLVHVVVSGARSRRRDLSVLRAMGLGARQVRGTIAWQATTLAFVTLAVAVPIGVVAGRFAWTRYAEGLGVVPEPVTPWLLLGVLVATLLVVALAVSVLPAWRAVRHRPIESLRSE